MDDSFELYDLKVEVIHDGKRPMICHHPEGSFFTVSGENIKIQDGATFPLYSLAALLPLLPAKQRMTHQNDWMTTDADIACPDPNCGGLFRIQRIGKTRFRHHEVTATPLVVTQESEGN